MKHSIKRQMITVFAGLVILMIGVFLFVNGCFLEKYYVYNKQKEFVSMYEALRSASENGKLMDEDVNASLTKMAQQNNISIVLRERVVVGGQIVIQPYTNLRDMETLENMLNGYTFGKIKKDILKKTDDYEISKARDPMGGTESIVLWSKFENGSDCILTSPLESIRDSVKLFNQFIGIAGLIIIIFSIFFAWYFSKRMTDPILELAGLSEQMADLDFDAKYTSGGSNEIGILGQNFNLMSEKLESTISDLKKANFELQKDIEQKEKIETMRTEFLGNVSHELKTPIALIQGYAEGLKEGVNDDAESREFYCDVIMDEASKMNQMVRNLLTLNQLEFGEDDVQFERFDIVALIEGVIQSSSILISQKEAEVVFRVDGPVYVWADEFKAEQVVRNYFNNALNHVAGDKVIEIKIQMENDTARVSVFNTGIPIPQEDVEHIWDKFYKVDKARTREYGGNGIGLSIVKAIMESFHKGYGINNYDNGVEFWFELDMK